MISSSSRPVDDYKLVVSFHYHPLPKPPFPQNNPERECKYPHIIPHPSTVFVAMPLPGACTNNINRHIVDIDILFLIYITLFLIPVVLHKAVAEVSNIGRLLERLVVVNHAGQNKPID